MALRGDNSLLMIRFIARLWTRLDPLFRPRYMIWRSTNGLDWIPSAWSWRECKALSMAAMFAARRRHFHVEVTDQWRNGRMVWYISADINKLAEYNRHVYEAPR